MRTILRKSSSIPCHARFAIGTVMSAFGLCAVIGVPTGLWLASPG
jgi:hypothetical protein